MKRELGWVVGKLALAAVLGWAGSSWMEETWSGDVLERQQLIERVQHHLIAAGPEQDPMLALGRLEAHDAIRSDPPPGLVEVVARSGPHARAAEFHPKLIHLPRLPYVPDSAHTRLSKVSSLEEAERVFGMPISADEMLGIRAFDRVLQDAGLNGLERRVLALQRAIVGPVERSRRSIIDRVCYQGRLAPPWGGSVSNGPGLRGWLLYESNRQRWREAGLDQELAKNDLWASGRRFVHMERAGRFSRSCRVALWRLLLFAVALVAVCIALVRRGHPLDERSRRRVVGALALVGLPALWIWIAALHWGPGRVNSIGGWYGNLGFRSWWTNRDVTLAMELGFAIWLGAGLSARLCGGSRTRSDDARGWFLHLVVAAGAFGLAWLVGNVFGELRLSRDVDEAMLLSWALVAVIALPAFLLLAGRSESQVARRQPRVLLVTVIVILVAAGVSGAARPGFGPPAASLAVFSVTLALLLGVLLQAGQWVIPALQRLRPESFDAVRLALPILLVGLALRFLDSPGKAEWQSRGVTLVTDLALLCLAPLVLLGAHRRLVAAPLPGRPPSRLPALCSALADGALLAGLLLVALAAYVHREAGIVDALVRLHLTRILGE